MITEADIRNLQYIIGGLVGVLFLLAAYLTAAPIGECSFCPHCRNARLVNADPTCPLHKSPRSKCEGQHGDD